MEEESKNREERLDAANGSQIFNTRDLGRGFSSYSTRGYSSCFCFEDGVIFKNNKYFLETRSFNNLRVFIWPLSCSQGLRGQCVPLATVSLYQIDSCNRLFIFPFSILRTQSLNLPFAILQLRVLEPIMQPALPPLPELYHLGLDP